MLKLKTWRLKIKMFKRLKNNIKLDIDKSEKIDYTPRFKFLVIYNLIILFLTSTVDWVNGFWGAVIIMGLVMTILVFFVTPILSFLLFRKHEKSGLIILASFIASILTFYGTQFFKNTGNIGNLVANIQEEVSINQIKNKETNIKIYNNDNFTIFLDPVSKQINIVNEKKTGGYTLDFIQLNDKLDTLKLNEIDISEDEFNRNIFSTKDINENIKMNIRFNEKEKNDLIFRIDNTYYIANLDYQYEVYFAGVIKDNISLNRLLTVSGRDRYDMEMGVSPYNLYEVYSNDIHDYVIINNITQSVYRNGTEYHQYGYKKLYKCLRDEKSDTQKFEEFTKFLGYSFIPEDVRKTTVNVDNDYVEDVIFYKFGNNTWLEIVPKNSEYSIFIEIFVKYGIQDITVK